MRNTDVPDKGTCFISGAISSCLSEYRYHFSDAEQILNFIGYETLAPTVFPTEGFTYDQYMNMNKALLLSCDTVFIYQTVFGVASHEKPMLWERFATHEVLQGKKHTSLQRVEGEL